MLYGNALCVNYSSQHPNILLPPSLVQIRKLRRVLIAELRIPGHLISRGFLCKRLEHAGYVFGVGEFCRVFMSDILLSG